MFEIAVRRNTERRLEIMDELLASGVHIRSREHFLKLINDRRKTDEQPIKIDQFSKHVDKLKALLIPHDIELKYTRGKGYYYTEPGFSVFKKELQDKDKNLLMLASSIFGIFKGTPLQDEFGELVNKLLKESYTTESSIDHEQLKLVQIGTGLAYGGTKWIPRLLGAIIDKESLEIQYINTKKRAAKKTICPYLLKQYNSRWYMVAYDYTCERPEKTNVFSLEGIQQIKSAQDPYYLDPGFNTDDYFKYCLGIWHNHQTKPELVKLEFSDYHEQLLATPLHHSQKSELINNGKTLAVEIEVFITPELESIILSYGNTVRVTTPKKLAGRISSIVNEIHNLYR